MEIPIDFIKHIKTFLPPHPLQHQIEKWDHHELCNKVWYEHCGKKDKKGTYFHTWFFNDSKDKIKAIKEFVKENDFELACYTWSDRRSYEKEIKERLRQNIKWIRGAFRDKIKEQKKREKKNKKQIL
jgi:hypothetical protein